MEGEQLLSIPAKKSKGSYFLLCLLYPNSLCHTLQAASLVGSVCHGQQSRKQIPLKR